MSYSRLTTIALAGVILMLLAVPTGDAQESTELEQQIREKQQRIEQLRQQAAQYEQSLKAKRAQRLTLGNQIAILTDRVNQMKIEIEVGEANIDATSLQIRELEQDIRSEEQELAQHKEDLGTLVRWYARTQDQSALRIVFTQPSFAAFAGQMKSLKTIQIGMADVISEVEEVRERLETNKVDLEDKRKTLVKTVEELQTQRLTLEAQQETKTYLLAETRSSEARYETLIEAAKREQANTSADITSLERAVREKLKERGIEQNGEAPAFLWPVSPSRGITAQFRDPDYPFRRAFEHTGIDIRAAQGTPIRAAASGYVARARTGGATGYGYVMIVHSGGLATVYGHVSQILVTQDSFVSQGQIIAKSGGLPGTPGAGPFSTGAHLHFEVRSGGVPTNPMDYLP